MISQYCLNLAPLKKSRSKNMAKKLNELEKDEILMELLTNGGWTLKDDRDAISKDFTFKNFVDAFAWMTKVAIYSEKIGHHPEWFNVYKQVKVTLTTHDCGGISDLDIKMAREMDALKI